MLSDAETAAWARRVIEAVTRDEDEDERRAEEIERRVGVLEEDMLASLARLDAIRAEAESLRDEYRACYARIDARARGGVS